MHNLLHVRRNVRAKTINEFAFREHIATRFQLSRRPDAGLHHTITQRVIKEPMTFAAELMRRLPDSSHTPIRVHVLGARAVGRSWQNNTESYALELEVTDELQEEVRYFQRKLGHNAITALRLPHITLVKGSIQPAPMRQKVIEAIEAAAPTYVDLSQVSIGIDRGPKSLLTPKSSQVSA